MSLATLPGDPDAVAAAGSGYEHIAEAIARSVARLREVTDGSGRGHTVTALAERAEGVADKLGRAKPRYSTTGSALRTYAVALREAQRSAAGAASEQSSRQGSLNTHRYRLENLIDERQTAIMAGDAQHADELRDRIAYETHRVNELDGEVREAEQAYHRAVEYRDAAARTAIEAISPVLEDLKDTFGSVFHAWVDSLPGFLQQIGRWVEAILVPLITAIQEAIATIVSRIGYLITFVSLLVQVLQHLPPEMWLVLLAGVGLILFGGVVGVVLGSLIIGVLGAVVLLLTQSLAADLNQPTPVMTPVNKTPVSRESAEGRGDRYAQVMSDDNDLDELGGADMTVVEVIEVLDENGNRIGWRVILPSTQDWQEAGPIVGNDPTGDKGAMNDWGSNLALMLTPEQQAAYERAVIQAMQKAGVGPDDPVMLCGFSQGGILAGKMAADPNSPFNIQAVFAAGASIDGMKIPDDVAVLSLQHTGDVVPMLDGPLSNSSHRGDNWYTYYEDPPVATDQPHNALLYGDTARKLDGLGDPLVREIMEEQDMFFSQNERSTLYSGAEPR
ncbi:alpha/beta hydrolase family protein [Protaetiibacter intestinalis]|uniref:Uncharacterized protein n=1 Tax=Protaetiibacter intestinalis TaxID=2419774 RepID=A0A387B4F3_9MICO|nr:hypothetical protein [Protaetiibacter intestinalis]AYF98524.1 hypothetical protein D7I47_09800 [Protaetiibacter intestinalis]